MNNNCLVPSTVQVRLPLCSSAVSPHLQYLHQPSPEHLCDCQHNWILQVIRTIHLNSDQQLLPCK